jgi:ferredoxin
VLRLYEGYFYSYRLDKYLEAAVRVEVDRDRCEGNAICVNLVPQLFELDADDYSVVKLDPVPAELEELAARAIRECPRVALRRGPD